MERIGDYETVQRLGVGVHGEVWLALPPARLGLQAARVAVKVLSATVGPQEFRRVLEELRLLAGVRSPHLAQIHEAGRWADRVYVTSEFFTNGSLARGTLDRRAAALAVGAAARGAHALHEAGHVHRDIRPSNIMLASGGAKLADPGLQHLIAPGRTVTGTGTLDSVEFLEPGMIRGEPAGRASDIWSLGLCYHQVLTGRSVYADLPDQSLSALLQHIVGAPSRLGDGLPPAAAAIVRRCTAVDRAERYRTALELAEAIEGAARAEVGS